jgi:hypothetical protein
MERKLSAGDFSTEDYYALADLYEQDGSYRKARDLLEQCFRLNGDEKSLELLAQITVNLAEESSEVVALVSDLAGYVNAGENYDTVMRTLKDETWFSTLMPKLKVGSRKYFLQLSDAATAYIEVGYEAENSYAQIWIMEGDSIRAVTWKNGAYQILSCGCEANQYQGAFEIWTIDENAREVIQETGTLDNGVLTGDYTAKIGSLGEGIAAADFWLTKEDASYTTYSGSFDAQGIPTVEQPDEANRSKFLENSGYETCLVYAYNESKTNCLWTGDVTTVTAEQLQLPGIPSYRIYEAKTQSSAPEEAPQIRVYDGVVQWFDGSKWVDVESVTQLAQEDPFADGGIQNVEGAEVVAMETETSNTRNMGSIITEKEASKSSGSSSKKTSSKSAGSNASSAASTGSASTDTSGNGSAASGGEVAASVGTGDGAGASDAAAAAASGGDAAASVADGGSTSGADASASASGGGDAAAGAAGGNSSAGGGSTPGTDTSASASGGGSTSGTDTSASASGGGNSSGSSSSSVTSGDGEIDASIWGGSLID